MSSNIINHTLSIFGLMLKQLPPFVPEDTKKELKETLEEAKEREDWSIEELENLMAVCGKKTWPEFQAFTHFYNKHENDFGHQLLLQRLSPKLKNKCETVFITGGRFRDIYVGATAHSFTPGERQELLPILVELKTEIDKSARHAVIHHHRPDYEAKIDYFRGVLCEIDEHIKKLDLLREQEEKEESHLASDIDSFIKAVNHSFARLGPAIGYEEIKNAHDHFLGRKKELEANPRF